MTPIPAPTPSPEEMDALLQRAYDLRAEAAARLFAALGRLLQRGLAAPLRLGRRTRRDGGCAQAA